MLVVCIILTIACVGTAVMGLRNYFVAKAEENKFMEEEQVYEEPDEPVELTQAELEIKRDMMIRKALNTGDKDDIQAAANMVTDVPSREKYNAELAESQNSEFDPTTAGVKADGFNDNTADGWAKDPPMDLGPTETDNFDIGDPITIAYDQTMLRVSPSYNSTTVGYWMAGDSTKIYDIELVDGVYWVNTHPTKNWWIPRESFEVN